jgi:MFS family permease
MSEIRSSTPTTSCVSPSATALAGFIALAVAMGIGRFAFTPVLPLMQDDYALSVRDAGWLAASNYIGYLLGSLAAAVIPLRPAAIRAGLVAIAALTAAMAAGHSFGAWVVLRGLAGFASALVFVAVSALTLGQLAALRRPFLNAGVYAGVGSGILAAGLVCLAMMHLRLRSTHAWMALGAAALLLSMCVWGRFVQNGAEPSKREGASRKHAWDAGQIRLVIAYGLFGFGYILPATFLPVMAKQSLDDPSLFGWSWPLFGLAAALSTLLLAVLPKSVDLRRAWIVAQVVMAIGVVVPLFWSGIGSIVASALSVGGTFMVITAAAMQEARRVAPHHAAPLIALMTSAFALGQIAGPLSVSLLPNVGSDFAVPLVTASILLLAGAGLIVRGSTGSRPLSVTTHAD